MSGNNTWIKLSVMFARGESCPLATWTGPMIRVFFAIACRINERNTCYPGIDTISRDTGVDARDVRKIIKRLKRIGVLDVIRKSGNEYHLPIYVAYGTGNNPRVPDSDVVDTPDGIPIELLNLSTRSYNALRRNGIKTVDSLAQMSDQDIMQLHNIGSKSLSDIIGKLDAFLCDPDAARNVANRGEIPLFSRYPLVEIKKTPTDDPMNRGISPPLSRINDSIEGKLNIRKNQYNRGEIPLFSNQDEKDELRSSGPEYRPKDLSSPGEYGDTIQDDTYISQDVMYWAADYYISEYSVNGHSNLTSDDIRRMILDGDLDECEYITDDMGVKHMLAGDSDNYSWMEYYAQALEILASCQDEALLDKVINRRRTLRESS